MKLKDIAMVRTGLVTKRKLATEESSERIKYNQLTLRSILPSGYVNRDMMEEYISCERLKTEYLARKDDVIVRLSSPYTAVLIDEEMEGSVVPSHFIIIRCDKSKILPSYLFWILNTEDIKNKISMSTGTNALGTIKPSFFNEIEIYKMTMENQNRISKMNILAKKEKLLLEKLAHKKEMYYSELINQIQKEMRSK